MLNRPGVISRAIVAGGPRGQTAAIAAGKSKASAVKRSKPERRGPAPTSPGRRVIIPKVGNNAANWQPTSCRGIFGDKALCGLVYTPTGGEGSPGHRRRLSSSRRSLPVWSAATSPFLFPRRVYLRFCRPPPPRLGGLFARFFRRVDGWAERLPEIEVHGGRGHSLAAARMAHNGAAGPARGTRRMRDRPGAPRINNPDSAE